MRIAICNADAKYSNFLKKTIYAYADLHRLDIYVECFLKGSTMISANNKYNLIILNESLLGENGFEVAERVRKELPLADIIFESNNSQGFVNAFKINPYRFLTSPLTAEKLNSVLDEYFEIRGNNYPIWIKSGLDTFFLNTDDIIYLEADNKKCFLQLDNERLSCNRTMGRVYEALPKSHFLKIHRSFVVNSNYITYFNSDCVCLKNGDTLHISRSFLKSFKTEYQRIFNPLIP